jgi:Flp pilus assembly protein protease CpaA
MFPLIPLIVAFAGSIYAAIWDLRTTEIPDEIPHAMIIFALLYYGIQSVIESNPWIFLNSVIAGGAIFILGFIMYYAGQWGGGDAKVLAAIIFLLPVSNTVLPFPITYLLNVFVVGAGYMIIYSFALAIRNRKIFSAFFVDVRKNKAVFAIGSVSLFAAFAIINYSIFTLLAYPINYLSIFQNSLIPVVAAIALFSIWRFAKAVEEVGFKRKIALSKLKVGDVLIENKIWEGITEKQLKRIKKSEKKFVWIKEGVRFAPTFPLALAFTLIYGDFLFLLLRLTL